LVISLRGAYREQQTKRERGQKSAPLFFRDAKVSADRKEFNHAFNQVSLALEYDPELVDARLLKGQLAIVLKDFTTAEDELVRYVRQRSDDKDAAQLLELCRSAGRDDSRAAAFVAVFDRQNAISMAEALEQNRDKLLQLYRKRLEAVWPGAGQQLQMDKDGKCRLNASSRDVKADLRDLSPLQGLPITELSLIGHKELRDLSGLQGVPLNALNLQGCDNVRDLTPLKSLPLTYLNINECPAIRDLSPLRGLRLSVLTIRYGQVTDLAPLRGMPLTRLELYACGQVADLSPLQGMPLTWLDINANGKIADLTPLQGMPLTEIYIAHPKLKGMEVLRPMKSLRKIGVGVSEAVPADTFWKKYDAGEFGK
jgi:hypothetical protein